MGGKDIVTLSSHEILSFPPAIAETDDFGSVYLRSGTKAVLLQCFKQKIALAEWPTTYLLERQDQSTPEEHGGQEEIDEQEEYEAREEQGEKDGQEEHEEWREDDPKDYKERGEQDDQEREWEVQEQKDREDHEGWEE